MLRLDKLAGSGKSNHVTISVSGFTSEDCSKHRLWERLVSHLQYSCKKVFDPQVYSLTWKAKRKSDLSSAIWKKLGIEDVSKVFSEAQRNAKISGRLLACSLAARDPFKSQTISLIGYSLGAQVLKSCLKTLDKIYFGLPCDIIQNVTFLAGAT